LGRLSELEQLIRPPLLPSQLERADARAAGEYADIRPIALIVARIRAALDQPV
jgi:hypothetical protein